MVIEIHMNGGLVIELPYNKSEDYEAYESMKEFMKSDECDVIEIETEDGEEYILNRDQVSSILKVNEPGAYCDA